MLIKSKAIDILFTTDGKEYVTRDHLMNEVKNECVGRSIFFFSLPIYVLNSICYNSKLHHSIIL